MRIFVAGATGVIGRLLVPALVGGGHDVSAMTRTEAGAGLLRSLGAEPHLADAFDAGRVAAAMRNARPEAVLHQLTDLSAADSAANAALRVTGTRNLVDAALAAGARRMVAQSIAWAYAPGGEPAAEDVALDLDADGTRRTTVQAIAALEAAVSELPEWVVLRYGLLYGPRHLVRPRRRARGRCARGDADRRRRRVELRPRRRRGRRGRPGARLADRGRQRLRRRASLRPGVDPGVLRRGRRAAATGRRPRARAVGAGRRQSPGPRRAGLGAAPPVMARRLRAPELTTDRNEEHAMDRRDRGRREFEALMGRPPEEALEEVRVRSPELYEAVVEGGFGGTLARPELARAWRQIATVAILAAHGDAERQLAAHAGAALRAGVAPSELRALCEHVAVYAGFPRALNALTVVDEVLRGAGVVRPAPLRVVALEDHETLVAERGDGGPPVVLIHALGLDWRMWEPVMEPLAAGRRVFAYDLRGHGRAAGAPAPYTMADTAADLAGVLDALGLDRAHVVGLSFGGGIAQTAAVAQPERFLSLALLATTDHPFEAFEARARSGETEGMTRRWCRA